MAERTVQVASSESFRISSLRSEAVRSARLPSARFRTIEPRAVQAYQPHNTREYACQINDRSIIAATVEVAYH